MAKTIRLFSTFLVALSFYSGPIRADNHEYACDGMLGILRSSAITENGSIDGFKTASQTVQRLVSTARVFQKLSSFVEGLG